MPGICDIIAILMTIACWVLWFYRHNNASPEQMTTRKTTVPRRRAWQKNEYPVRGPAPVPGKLPAWALKAAVDSCVDEGSPITIVEEPLSGALVPAGHNTVLVYPVGELTAPLNIVGTETPVSPCSPVPTLGGSYLEIAPDGVPFNSGVVLRRRRRTHKNRPKAVVKGTRASRLREERGRQSRIGVSVRMRLEDVFAELE